MFLDSIQHRSPDQNYSYIAFAPFVELTIKKNLSGDSELVLSGEENKTFSADKVFAVMRRLLRKYRSVRKSPLPYFSGGALGYWAYEMVSLFEEIQFSEEKRTEIPLLYQGFFRDVIVYDHKQSMYSIVTNAAAGSMNSEKAARRRVHLYKNLFIKPTQKAVQKTAPVNCKPEISKTKFVRMVKKAKRYINAGDIYQANLSQKFSLEFNGSKLDLYGKLRKINPSPFASFLKIRDIEVISSSPERLVSKRGRQCETRPIAGTRPIKRQNKTLRSIKKDLLANPKERAEHIMLVDLERNDLGRVCDWRSVKVDEMMTLEKYSHVIHIVSKISGLLKPEYDALDLLAAMFPGGTITGCPKIRCMQIIDELEPGARGLYTGSIGYIDFCGNMDLNIVIRTLVFNKAQGNFQVGAGIVYDSDPEREYAETLHKGEALTEALQAVCAAGKKK